MLMKKLFTLFVSLWMAMVSLFAANMTGGEVFYLTPHTTWNSDNARYAIYFFNNSTNQNTWVSMTKVEGESNLWKGTTPSGNWANLIFCRMNPSATANNWNNNVYWGGQTQDLTWDGTNNHFTVNSSKDAWNKPAGTWSLYVVEPVITVGAAPEFATTTVGETSNATVTYTLENADNAEATIEGEGFSIAEQSVGSVTITFAPEAEGEYTGTLTITSGDVKETVAVKATAVAPEAPKVPEILHVSAAEFAEIMEGETTSVTVTYELVNAEEATATVEGEGFAITAQETGSVTIEFAPTAAGEYTGKLIIAAGEVVKEVALAATAKKAPVIVTISFVNPEWTAANLYAWGAEGLPSTWPGLPMTKGENGKFTYDLTIPENGEYNFIINNGNGVQSVDMPGVTESTCYILGAKVDTKYQLAVSENCEYAVAPEPDPIDPYAAIRGLGEGTEEEAWSEAKQIKLDINEDATEEEWFIKDLVIAEGKAFKVVYVNAKSETAWYGAGAVEANEDLGKFGEGEDNITLAAGKYDIYFKVATGTMWIAPVKEEEPEPDPLPIVITFEDEVEFPKTFVGETTNDIINFTIGNAPEEAEVNITVTGDEAFSIAEIQDGYVVLAFAPEAEGEYAGVLTVTVGDASESLEFTALASAKSVDPDEGDDEGEEPSNEITFTVQVPEGTVECWIAGTGTPAWTFIQMEAVEGEANMFTLTTTKDILDGVEWKYSSGNDWQYCEKIDGGGNRTEAGNPDVVTAWQKLYDPDFQPIDPYYAIRGLNGDSKWTGTGDIKLVYNETENQWAGLGFIVAEGESFKVVYINENGDIPDDGYYAGLEENCNVGQTSDKDGNIVLPAGKYNLYFKPATGLMWISIVEDTTTDAEEAIAELIYAIDGTIYAPAPFAIIDLAGKDVTKANGALEGAYIVKTQNSVTKVLVK